MAAKKHPKLDKKFAPEVIGNKKAKFLTDAEMLNMHKIKKPTGFSSTVDPRAPHMPVAPKATYRFNSREA